MKKIIFAILFILIFVSFTNAQEVVVAEPSTDFNGIDSKTIKNIIEQNYTQLKLADNNVKVFYTTEKNKFVITRLSKFTYAASYALVTIDGKTINIVDLDYNPKESDFSLYEEKAKLNKTATNDVDFLFASFIDGPPNSDAINAINISAGYASNLGYNVQVLLGTNANVTAVKNYITNNNLIGMGFIGDGTPFVVKLSGGVIEDDWFASQDLRGEVFFFNSCNVFNDPFRSAMLNSGGARTFIGGRDFLPIHNSEYVLQHFWDYTLNAEWGMMAALTQARIICNLDEHFYGRGGDLGVLKLATSGTLSRNEVWIKEMNLTGNIYVPTGKSLVFQNGCTVNLNGYTIISTGGTITREAGATINGLKATLINGGIKGLYPTIATAIDAAPSNSTVELVNGTINETFSVYGKNNLSINASNTILTGTQSFNWCDNLTIIVA